MKSKILNQISHILPGVGLAILIVVIAKYLANIIKLILHLQKSPISTIMIAIILGMIIKNVIHLPQICNPGIRFCLTRLLRLGIILMGIDLSIFTVLKVGGLTVWIVALCVIMGLSVTTFIARCLKLPERLGSLIAVGTSICGASAIVATGTVIKAKEEEIAYAVGTITIFGTVVMFAYPYLSHLVLSLSYIQSGIFMGLGVHETAQVAGAGLIYDQLWMEKTTGMSGADVAIVTKLVRNTFMVIVIPLMAYIYTRRNTDKIQEKIRLLSLFPMFILGFIAMAIVRSVGDYLINQESWSFFCYFIKDCAGNLLAIAMAGVGLGTDLQKLKHLGIKPFFTGLLGALSMGVTSFVLIKIGLLF